LAQVSIPLRDLSDDTFFSMSLIMQMAALAVTCLASACFGQRLQRESHGWSSPPLLEKQQPLQVQPLDSLARLLFGFLPTSAFCLARASAVCLHCRDLGFTTPCLAIRNRIGTAPLMDDDETKHLVIVEGATDTQAVSSACGKEVFCMSISGRDRGRKLDHPRRWEEIQAMSKAFPDCDLIVLTDCDEMGCKYRDSISESFPEAKHAFLGRHLSSAKDSAGVHRKGNVGVEHATPEDIRNAIADARAPQRDRNKYTEDHLMQWGFSERNDDRRRLFLDYLGIFDRGKRNLLKNLNLFFDDEDIEKALGSLPKEGEMIPPDTGSTLAG